MIDAWLAFFRHKSVGTCRPLQCVGFLIHAQDYEGTFSALYADPLGSHSSRYDRPGSNFLERPNGTGNAGFCDGHARAMKHMELYNNGVNAPYFNCNQ